MQEYIDLAERGEWDPTRWRISPNPRRNPALFVVDVSDEQRASLEARAREQGLDSCEYLNRLVSTVLSVV